MKKNVFHGSISLEKGSVLDEKTWTDIGHEYMAHMGFENSPYSIIRHNNTEHDHIHIMASRVDYDGQVVSDSMDMKRSMEFMRELEIRYNLQILVTPKLYVDPEEKNKKNKEIYAQQKLNEEGEKLNKLRIKERVDKAIKSPEVLAEKTINEKVKAFIGLLEKSDIGVKTYTKSDKKIYGITYDYNNKVFKASTLGKKYGIQHLNIVFDQQIFKSRITEENQKRIQLNLTQERGELIQTISKAIQSVESSDETSRYSRLKHFVGYLKERSVLVSKPDQIVFTTGQFSHSLAEITAQLKDDTIKEFLSKHQAFDLLSPKGLMSNALIDKMNLKVAIGLTSNTIIKHIDSQNSKEQLQLSKWVNVIDELQSDNIKIDFFLPQKGPIRLKNIQLEEFTFKQNDFLQDDVQSGIVKFTQSPENLFSRIPDIDFSEKLYLSNLIINSINSHKIVKIDSHNEKFKQFSDDLKTQGVLVRISKNDQGVREVSYSLKTSLNEHKEVNSIFSLVELKHRFTLQKSRFQESETINPQLFKSNLLNSQRDGEYRDSRLKPVPTLLYMLRSIFGRFDHNESERSRRNQKWRDEQQCRL